ncbi:hypothetical protein ACFLWS_03425 [Chloroflexota bacterium]
MTAYVTRRLLLMIPTLFLVTLIIFFSVRFIPGSVIDLMIAQMGGEVAEKDLAIMEKDITHKLGLDVPVHVQYGRWLGIAR